MATVYKGCNSGIAHMREVKVVVREHRDVIAVKAKALLAEHRRTGDHKIRTLMEDTDGLVILEGRSPLSVEFGRQEYIRSGPDGQQVYVGPMMGLHILGRAAGL